MFFYLYFDLFCIYLILSYLILSYLSYLILSYLILSYLILSYLKLSYLILSHFPLVAPAPRAMLDPAPGRPSDILWVPPLVSGLFPSFFPRVSFPICSSIFYTNHICFNASHCSFLSVLYLLG